MMPKTSRGPGRPKADPELRAARNRRAPQPKREDDAPWDPVPVLLARLRDEPMPEDTEDHYAHTYHYAHHEADPSHSTLRALWAMHRDELIAEWALKHPGRRPSLWWVFDGPRLSGIPRGYGAWVLRLGIEPRLRLGGQGQPHERWVLTTTNSLCGLPRDWEVAGFDPADPPIFESQASYLKRHGLLVRGESLRLRAAHFKPEVLPTTYWPKGATR